MKTISLLLLSSLLCAIACGPAKDKAGAIPGFDNNVVEEAEFQLCARNQKLKEITTNTNFNLNQLNRQTQFFAFSSTTGNSSCVLNGSYGETIRQDGLDMWLNVIPNTGNGCLKNNSIWSVVSASVNGNTQYYYFKSTDSANARLMEMNGHKNLNGDFLRKRLGLKMLECR